MKKLKTQRPKVDIPESLRDSVVECQCEWLIEPLRSDCLNHLAAMSEDEATGRLLTFGLIKIELSQDPWGKGFPQYYHARVTKRRGALVLAQGHGASARGALIMALTHHEWDLAQKSPHQPKNPDLR